MLEALIFHPTPFPPLAAPEIGVDSLFQYQSLCHWITKCFLTC